MDPRTLVIALCVVNPLLAFWIAGLARVDVDAEILSAAWRLHGGECGQA